MLTELIIPRILRKYINDQESVSLQGATLSELLIDLKNAHPALYQCVCTESGQVRRHLHLFINATQVKDEQWNYVLKPGDVISVFQAVSGG